MDDKDKQETTLMLTYKDDHQYIKIQAARAGISMLQYIARLVSIDQIIRNKKSPGAATQARRMRR